MGKLGNIGGIQAEAGFETVRAFKLLDERLIKLEADLSNVRRNAATVLDNTSITVRVAGGPDIGTRPRLNFIGGVVSIAGVDDPNDAEVDLTLTLPTTAVTPGSYTYGSFTVDDYGRLTAASSGATPQPADADLTEIAALSNVAGDLLYTDATPAWNRLAKGSDGEVLTMVSGLPDWEPAAAGGTLDPGDMPAIATPTPPSVDTVYIFSRVNGSFIDVIVQSNGQEFVLASLINTAHINTLLFNGIE